MNPFMLAVFAIWKTLELGGKAIRGELSKQGESDKAGEMKSGPKCCPKCDIQLTDGSRFCSTCGLRLDGESQE